MTRPSNPYREGTLRWSLMEGGLQGEFDGLPGWEDLTIRQIAELFDKTELVIRHTITDIRQQTGFSVPYTSVPRGGLRVSEKKVKNE